MALLASDLSPLGYLYIIQVKIYMYMYMYMSLPLALKIKLFSCDILMLHPVNIPEIVWLGGKQHEKNDDRTIYASSLQ